MRAEREFATVVVGIVTLAVWGGTAQAEGIDIPNASFELPVVVRDEQNPFGALPYIDDWDETAVGPADEYHQDTGAFLNTDPPAADHVTNAHGNQLAFVSSLMGNSLRQELNAAFVPGRQYNLTVATGTSSHFAVGADERLEIALFYFDNNVEQVIASGFVFGSQVNATSLIDVNALVSMVGVDDPWANRPIGILVRPWLDDLDDADGEGFWNLDNVRLTSVPEPASLIALALGACALGLRRRRA